MSILASWFIGIYLGLAIPAGNVAFTEGYKNAVSYGGTARVQPGTLPFELALDVNWRQHDDRKLSGTYTSFLPMTLGVRYYLFRSEDRGVYTKIAAGPSFTKVASALTLEESWGTTIHGGLGYLVPLANIYLDIAANYSFTTASFRNAQVNAQALEFSVAGLYRL